MSIDFVQSADTPIQFPMHDDEEALFHSPSLSKLKSISSVKKDSILNSNSKDNAVTVDSDDDVFVCSASLKAEEKVPKQTETTSDDNDIFCYTSSNSKKVQQKGDKPQCNGSSKYDSKEPIIKDDKGWCDSFSSISSSFQGFVESKEQLEQLKWKFEVESKAFFVAARTSKNFGSTDIKSKPHQIQWVERNDTHLPDHPYIVLETQRYECHHGIDRNRSKKEKAKEAQQCDHASYQKKRFHVQMTKKMDCPAIIIAKEIVFFPQYNGSITNYRRKQVSKEIKKMLRDDDSKLQVKRMISVTLPVDHENHLPGELSELSLPIDPRIKAKIEEYVTEGFTSSSCIRSLVEQFVTKELFAGDESPSWTNRRFFPSQKDISNMIYTAKVKNMKSKYDQENLKAHMSEWRKECPDDNFYFSATEIQEHDSSSGFFFIYQSQWQRRLLNLYGNELCLLDATYRTTKYAVPLFFLCVKTNVDYLVVAICAIQYENSHSISKALQIIKEWNPEWRPKHFMVDHCEAELNAIATCFPNCQAFICDFHREQAWGRWLKASKHGLAQNADLILTMMRRIARAPSATDLAAAVSSLKGHPLWNCSKELRDWFTNTWLKNVKMWAWVHRKDRLLVNINTNNGVERQNKTLKYEYLGRYTDRSLTGMLTTVIKRYLPEQYRSYLMANVTSSALYKRYNKNLPAFLHNRPKEFVDHCRKRLSSAEAVEGKVHEGEGLFTVSSFTKPHTNYAVSLGTEMETPFCECQDWVYTHWPCKHMLAIVMYYPGYDWNNLADHYRNNPMFVLDQSCLDNIGFKVPDDTTEEPEDTVPVPEEITISKPTENDISISIREELNTIKSLSYLQVPLDIQRKVLIELEVIRNLIVSSVPTENGLPLNEEIQSVKTLQQQPFNITRKRPKLGLKRKASHIKRKYTELPSRRKRKPVKKRWYQKEPFEKEQNNLVYGESTTFLEETIPTTKSCIPEKSTVNNRSQHEAINTRENVFESADIVSSNNNASIIPQKSAMKRRGELSQTYDQLTKARKQDCGTANRKMRVRFADDIQSMYKDKHIIQTSNVKRPLGGLINRSGKNLCFANSVLQCLRMTDIKHIIGAIHISENEFVESLRSFFEYNGPCAENICKKMEKVWRSYRVGHQEDCHEFLITVLNEIYECITNEGEMIEMEKIFKGSLNRTVTCCSCDSENITQEPYLGLNIPLKAADDLHGALRNYFAMEMVDTYNCVRCKKNTIALKGTKIEKMPKYLIIQLNRFTTSGKTNKSVDIPKILKVREHVMSDQVLEDKLRLFAFIKHNGASTSSGHYIAYVEHGMQWFKIDDMKITAVRNIHPDVNHCYVLFYKCLPRPYID